MSDNTETAITPDEMTVLKARADLLKVAYHPSIGLEKLREKVAAAMSGEDGAKPSADKDAPAAVVEPVPETEGQLRNRLKREATALVRIRVTCMNPAKTEWPGEIFTAGNSVIGSIKKFVPFNADDGWHVPHIIYQVMRDRQCAVYTAGKDSRGNKTRVSKLIREFAIEVLPQLSPEELSELAARQAATGAIG